MPTPPTPEEAALWMIEAHLLSLAGALSEERLDAISGHLDAVWDAMEHPELLQALRAMAEVSARIARQCRIRDGSAEDLLRLLREDAYRRQTRPLPADPTAIGHDPARRMARELAGTALQRYLAEAVWDHHDHQRWSEDVHDLTEVVQGRSRHQLVLIDHYLGEFERNLDPAAYVPVLDETGPLPGREACLQAIWCRLAAIADASRRAFRRTGTMTLAWATWQQTFPDAGASTPCHDGGE